MTSTDRICCAFAVVVVFACLFAYSLSLAGPLFFDDVPNLTENPLIKIDGKDFDDWRVAAISTNAGLFHRPVSMLSFAANYVATGNFSPISLKATNLFIHLLTGTLIYFLCYTLLRAPALSGRGITHHQLVALAATAIWLLHPLHVSTVLYVIQRMAQLSTLLTLLGLLVYSRYRLRWAQVGAGTGELLASGLWLTLITLFAVLSKENGALLPWLIIVVEVTLFHGMWNGCQNRVFYRASCFVLVAPVILVVLVLLLSPGILDGKFAGRDFSLQERLYTQARVLWTYLGWIVLPKVSSMGFFHDDIPKSYGLFSPFTTAVAILAWLGVLVAAIALRKIYPMLLFALLFYLVAHSMESTILPLELVFEHRNYLPSVGICFLLAVALCQLASNFRNLRFPVMLGIVLVVLFAQLLIRSNAWTDSMTLARFNVVNHPESSRANFFYGNTLFEQFMEAEAEGRDPQEQKALAVSAREYFKRSHELNKLSLAPLVMLYQLDSLHFPALAEQGEWLAHLESLVDAKRLQSSDRSALHVLVSFTLSRHDHEDRARVEEMMTQLASRYPKRMDLLTLLYRMHADERDADNAELRDLLLQAAQRGANNRQIYAFLVQYHGSDDLSQTYDYIQNWMQLDTQRREIGLVRRIFER